MSDFLDVEAPPSDLHVHTELSSDARRNSLGTVVSAAAALGFREIGITDHVQAASGGAPGFERAPDPVEGHQELAGRVRAGRWPLRVLVSWEVDYFDGGRYSFEPSRDLRSLDYVLLGHHYCGHVRSLGDRELARYLLRIHLEMAAEPYADILAHPFYLSPPERHGPVLRCISDRELEQFFLSARGHGKAIEVTSWQFTASHRDVDQSRRVYAVARRCGCSFVLSSDAHAPEQIGDGMRCAFVLRSLGFRMSDFLDYGGLMRARSGHRR